jgi:release factor glutamine methyltransferase
MPDHRLFAVMSKAAKQLAAAEIDNPHLDARILIQHILGCDRMQMLTGAERILSDDDLFNIQKIIARRTAHEPVARIIGEREFWGLSFGLNEATLEPRPDSETLVEAVLSVASHERPIQILDLGTGTGCLLLSLLHELPEAEGLGIDIAQRAVEQATINAENLGLMSRAKFQLGDWLAGIAESFDIIISNPPYIIHDNIMALQPEVRENDPLRALDGGMDGLDDYRKLIPLIPKSLNAHGVVAMEVGQGQAQFVADLMKDAGLKEIKIYNDLAGIERCLVAQI